MDWFTAKDWEDLQVALIISGIFVAFGFLHWFWLGRNASAAAKRDPLGIFVASYVPMPLFFLAYTIWSMLERRGVPGWYSAACFFALFMIFYTFSGGRLQRDLAQKAELYGIDNPGGVPVPPIGLSGHEKKLQLKILAVLVGITIAVVALAYSLAQPVASPSAAVEGAGKGSIWTLLLFTAGLIGIPAYVIAGRWPRPVSRSAEIEIDATPKQVWDAIVYRSGMDHYRGIYSRIEKVEGTVPTFQLHYKAEGNCGECGLPKHPDAGGITSLVQVLEAREPHRYVIRSSPKGLSVDKGETGKWLDSEDESFDIIALQSGGSRVSSKTLVQRPKVWLALLIRVGDPLGEQLRDLKAVLEGRNEDSLYAVARERFSAARNAPRHCGCSSSVAVAPA